LTYYKEEVGGLVMGGYEPDPLPWAVDGFRRISTSSCCSRTGTLPADLELAMARVPALESAGIKSSQRAREFHARRQFHPGPARASRASLSARASMRSALHPAAAQARCSPSGSSAGEAPFDVWPVDNPQVRCAAPGHRLGRKRTLELYGKH